MSDRGATPAPERGERRPAHRGWSFPLGRLAGIQIRVHLSFFLVVALFWAASTAPDGLGVVSGMLWLALIFASVTVHELSHSVVARSRGIRVRAIVLLPIGGVSELESMTERPSDELAVSVVGPLSSLAIAGIAAGLAVLAGVPLTPVDLGGGALLPRLAWFNLLVGCFNLLPAFPMDGGRVLRSALEGRHDLERATRIAARTGRGFAAVMVVAGIFFNPWLTFIGIFVWFGATGEEAATVLHVRLAGRRVRDVMVERPIVVDAATPTDRLVTLARTTAQREFPVVEDGRYAGMVSFYGAEHAPAGTLVGDAMQTDVPVVAPGDSLEESAVPALSASGTGALAVVHGGTVVGLLRTEDVAHLLQDPAA